MKSLCSLLLLAIAITSLSTSCEKAKRGEEGLVCGNLVNKVVSITDESGKLYFTDSLASGAKSFKATYFIELDRKIDGIGGMPLSLCNGILDLEPNLNLYDTLLVKFDGKIDVFEGAISTDAVSFAMELQKISRK